MLFWLNQIYSTLVNNRKYVLSRVRSPARESFIRDLARIRGGDNDFVIAATLQMMTYELSSAGQNAGRKKVTNLNSCLKGLDWRKVAGNYLPNNLCFNKLLFSYYFSTL